MPMIITRAAKEQPTAIATTWLSGFPVGVGVGAGVDGGVGGLHFSTMVEKTEKFLKARTVEAPLAPTLITPFNFLMKASVSVNSHKQLPLEFMNCALTLTSCSHKRTSPRG